MLSVRAGDLANECGIPFDTLRASLHQRNYPDPTVNTVVSAKHADDIRKIFGTGPIVLRGASPTVEAVSEIFGAVAGNSVRAKEEKRAQRAERAARPSKQNPNLAWAYAFFEPTEREAWVKGGLGIEQAEVAARARAAGLTPADLRKQAGQRAVWQWLVIGEDPRRIVERLNYTQSQRKRA